MASSPGRCTAQDAKRRASTMDWTSSSNQPTRVGRGLHRPPSPSTASRTTGPQPRRLRSCAQVNPSIPTPNTATHGAAEWVGTLMTPMLFCCVSDILRSHLSLTLLFLTSKQRQSCMAPPNSFRAEESLAGAATFRAPWRYANVAGRARRFCHDLPSRQSAEHPFVDFRRHG